MDQYWRSVPFHPRDIIEKEAKVNNDSQDKLILRKISSDLWSDRIGARKARYISVISDGATDKVPKN